MKQKLLTQFSEGNSETKPQKYPMTVGSLEKRLLEAQADVLTAGSSFLKQMRFELILFSALDIMKKKES